MPNSKFTRPDPERNPERVFRPRFPGDDPHPHACSDGVVFLTYTTHDEEVGDEVERIESIPCRRCATEVEEAGRFTRL